MRSLILALLVLVGCSNAVDVPLDTTQEDPAIRPTVGLDPAIADLALSAVVLWEQASGGLYQPDVHLGCDGTETLCIREVPGMIEGCGANQGEFNGCYLRAEREIHLSEGMYLDEQIYTLAHELGHSLGLGHAPTGLMRARGAEHTACVDEDTLAAFAARFGADPATLAPVCYGDDVRQAMLAQLSEMQ